MKTAKKYMHMFTVFRKTPKSVLDLKVTPNVL
jgi:hypothetical protein